jgi:hypothetical protein
MEIPNFSLSLAWPAQVVLLSQEPEKYKLAK